MRPIGRTVSRNLLRVLALVALALGGGCGWRQLRLYTYTVELGQRAVLHIIFYRAMGGDGWKHNTNWMTDAPLDSWTGVEADAQGNVIQLMLDYNSVTGSIPPELGNLENPEFLQLSGTEVTGAFLREIGNLTSLTSLHVMSCHGYRTDRFASERIDRVAPR